MDMKNKPHAYILLICILLLGKSAFFAQEDLLFTQFWNVKNFLNPATSGLNYKHQANALARWQWLGVNGAPDSQLLSYSMKLDKLHGGLGFSYLRDKIGFSTSNKAVINYSYQIKFKNEGIISFGLAAGIQHYSSNPTWIPPTTSPDSSLPSKFSDTKFTSDFGVAYSKNRFNSGISVTQLNQARYGNNSIYYQSARRYYIFTDYIFGDEDDFQIKPQILIRTDFVKLSADLNLMISYKSKYWIGLSYRTSDAISFSAGWNFLNEFRVGYSYDLTINKLSSISKGSHEVHLGFYLK